MKRFGEELKAVRESQNISLQDISKKTRISLKFIEAIEAGNLSILPQTYIRAFIKSYAKEVGLSAEKTIAKYEQCIGNQNFESKKTDAKLKPVLSSKQEQTLKTTPPSVKKTNENAVPPEPPPDSKSDIADNKQDTLKENTDDSKNNLQPEHVQYVETPKANYIVLCIIVLVLAAILYYVVLKVPSEETVLPERVPIDTIVEEIEQEHDIPHTETVTDSVPVINHAILSDSLVLGILTETDVWVSVRVDQQGGDRGFVNANNIKYVKAKDKFTVTAARGKQIKIYLNNKLLGNLSQSDSVRTAVVTLNGIVYLKPTVTPAKRNEETDLKPLEPVFP